MATARDLNFASFYIMRRLSPPLLQVYIGKDEQRQVVASSLAASGTLQQSC